LTSNFNFQKQLKIIYCDYGSLSHNYWEGKRRETHDRKEKKEALSAIQRGEIQTAIK
jgi:hypothetical protein